MRFSIARRLTDMAAQLRAARAPLCHVQLEARIRELERSLEAMTRESDSIGRLRTIPGVGLLTASALVVFVGDVQRFPSARQLDGTRATKERGCGLGNNLKLARLKDERDLDTPILHQSVLS